MRRAFVVPVLVLLLWASQADAQDGGIRVERRADGVLMFTNNPKPGRWPSRRRSEARMPPYLASKIARWARTHRLDPRLVAAVVRVESAFDPGAVSHKGAMGLMQLMPETARQMGVRDAFDVDENLRGGTAYLRQMMDRFDGSLRLALASYNAGPTAVERYRGIPPYKETTEYVRRVLAAYGAGAHLAGDSAAASGSSQAGDGRSAVHAGADAGH